MSDQPRLKQDHEIRWMTPTGHKTRKTINTNPMQAIRRKCLDCSGGSFNEVSLCTISDCPLYPFRSGKRPEFEGIERKKRKGNPKALAVLAANRAKRKAQIDSEPLEHSGEGN